jgi:hypothetical protein
LTPTQEQQLRHDAAERLADGVSDAYGNNDRTREAIVRLRTDLEDTKIPIDLRVVEELLRDIPGQRAEAAPIDAPAADEEDLLKLNPERVPPPYRRSVEKYFEKLSEQP